jgi:hypothetical protein
LLWPRLSHAGYISLPMCLRLASACFCLFSTALCRTYSLGCARDDGLSTGNCHCQYVCRVYTNRYGAAFFCCCLPFTSFNHSLCLSGTFWGSYRDILAPGYGVAVSTQQWVAFNGLRGLPCTMLSSPAPWSLVHQDLSVLCVLGLAFLQAFKGTIRALLGCAGC